MSALESIILGLTSEAVFWGSISAALLWANGIRLGTWVVYAVCALSYLWGYRLGRSSPDFLGRRMCVFAVWFAPVLLLAFLLASTLVSPRILPWGMVMAMEAAVYMGLWALCSARGYNWARGRELHVAQRESVFGTVILAALASFWGVHKLNLASSALAFALLSSVNISATRRREVLGAAQSDHGMSWVAGGGVFLAVGLMAAALVSMGGAGAAAWVWGWIMKAFLLLGTLVIYALSPVGKLAEWVILWLRQFMNWKPPDTAKGESLFDEMLEALRENQVLAKAPPWVSWVLAVSVVAVLVWLIWRLCFRADMKRQKDVSYAETRTSLLEKGTLRNWVEESLEGVTSGLRKAVSGLIDSLALGPPGTLSELYLRTLKIVSSRVIPRELGMTPFEYLELALEHVSHPEGRSALQYITGIFCDCYYSGRAPMDAEWKDALEAYRILARPDTLRPEAAPYPGTER